MTEPGEQKIDMEDCGMDSVLLAWPDGTYSLLGGMVWYYDMTLVGSLSRQKPPEARLYADKESLLVNIEMRLH